MSFTLFGHIYTFGIRIVTFRCISILQWHEQCIFSSDGKCSWKSTWKCGGGSCRWFNATHRIDWRRKLLHTDPKKCVHNANNERAAILRLLSQELFRLRKENQNVCCAFLLIFLPSAIQSAFFLSSLFEESKIIKNANIEFNSEKVENVCFATMIYISSSSFPFIVVWLVRAVRNRQ